MKRCYQPSAGFAIEIDGDAATIAHFDHEYAAWGDAGGSATTAGEVVAATATTAANITRATAAAELPAMACAASDQASVRVFFVDDARSMPPGSMRQGYKTVRWQVDLSAQDAPVLEARISLHGRPRAFARSLVQGLLVEPLLSVAAGRAGSLLLPAAAFGDERGVVVVLGRSRSGKTSLSMHALALGTQVLGDDQVAIGADGLCRPFSRRLRVYSDLRKTVPLAWRRLPRGAAAGLTGLGLLRRASRGRVAPPLLVPRSIFKGRAPVAGPIRRVVIMERPGSAGDLRVEPASTAEAVATAVELLREQRTWLARAGGDEWHRQLADLAMAEVRLVEGAFEHVPVVRLVAPSPLEGDAVSRIWGAVGLGNET